MKLIVYFFLIAETVLLLSQGVEAHQRKSDDNRAIYADKDFWKENEQAMDMMMSQMSVSPTGNVDDDFVAMMVPHHRGAIAMSLAELKFGKNEFLKRIAQEIIVTQQQEIIAMYKALDKPSSVTAVTPTLIQPESSSPGHREH